jgi:NodT family efflux transporter outer membrane factor (OMF) lipoprotein
MKIQPPAGPVRATASVRKGRVRAALLLATALAACSNTGTGDFSTAPRVPVARNFAAYGAAQPGIVDSGWIHTFRSQILVRLVNEAIANNQDLRAASFRVAEARAIARQSGAPLYPSLTAEVYAPDSGRLEVNGQPEPTDNFQSRFDIAWEADVWGRLRGRREAAYIDAAAEVAIFEAVRQSLAAEVTSAWIQVAGDSHQLRLAREELSVRSRMLNNVEQRIAAQTLLEVDGNIVRANVARARARVALAEGNLAHSARVLEVLLGRYPSAELRNLGGLPGMPGRVPVGLPSQLLERRPDLVARERRVAAAFHRVREARAARLPVINLTANLVGNGGNLGNSLDPVNIIWTIAGGIIAPLIDGGERAEEVKVRTARQERALAEYGAAALRAFQEVEDALSNEQVLAQREAQLGRAVNELRSAVDFEQQRYEAGEIDLTRVDDALLRYFESQRDLSDARVARLQNRVALHLALGGSFEVQPAQGAAESAGATGTSG